VAVLSSQLLSQRSEYRCSLLRASTEHILIVRGLRARGASAPFQLPKWEKASGNVSLSTNKKATVPGGLFFTPPSIAGWCGAGWSTCAHRTSTVLSCAFCEQRDHPALLCSYVPISHDARYFTCSFVSVSIFIPIPASLSRAISLSITGGTG
jgi:hypothetical protein